MRHALVAATIVGLCAMGFGASAAGDPKDELVKLEADWSKASVAKDTAAVSRIVAPDWTGQNPSGKLTTRDKMLADMKSGVDAATSMTNHDVHVRLIGDIAIVQGSDDEKSTHMGKDTSGAYTWTDVFQKRAGHWVAIASQVTPVAPAK
ncbi:MAG TPA: nuclear transport factor 2 family protein [Phenylobacterium sp.]|jgi:ketosteroid isomerase-like protein|uniref:nuclear transport factor 2 family protein n=1 Tax=Phenylobacterium sp. TaxID=1871053 RepID=UPI002C7BBD5B|nr:nuclear transport factor 2 family protein [Phenylobacterium sp.]HXA39702.1 nuclear transport factor 2 family protein [Phenylobacterium sp.]